MGEPGELQQSGHGDEQPTSKPPATAVFARESSFAHMGPLPIPDVLAGYEQVHTGLAERIVKMAEENHKHRIAMDMQDAELRKTAVEAEIARGKRGQWMAFIIIVLVLLVGLVIALATGDGKAAAGLVAAAVAALAAVFALQWHSGRQREGDNAQ